MRRLQALGAWSVAAASILIAPAPMAGAETTAASPASATAGAGHAADEGRFAHAILKATDDREVGRVSLEETTHGVIVRARFSKLPPGTHAFHVHAVGKCEPPFTSAGGHFNPASHKHGFAAPEGYHAGDLPNVEVPNSGALEVTAFEIGATLSPGSSSLLDADGSALVVHEGADDYTSDPAGNAGSRIACGVVERGAMTGPKQ
jgi:superoxide dismutase, Cu-Zn family